MPTPTQPQSQHGLPTTIRPVATQSPQAAVAELLLNAPLFQDMDPSDISVLARFLTLCNVEEGGIVFREGDPGEFMGLIVEGVVDLFKDGPADHPVHISTENYGKMLGEMSIIDGEPRSATARFQGRGQVLILTKESFQRLLHEHPRAAANFLYRLSRTLSQRLRRTTGNLTQYLK